MGQACPPRRRRRRCGFAVSSMKTHPRGSRDRRRRCSPCPFSSSRADALRAGWVSGRCVSHGSSGGEEERSCSRRRVVDGALRAEGCAMPSPSMIAASRARVRRRSVVVFPPRGAPRCARRARAGRGRAIARLGGHVHTGTTVVSSASSSPSPFLRFRRFLNPGKDKISSFGVGRAPAALRPRPEAEAASGAVRPRSGPCSRPGPTAARG